MDNKKRFVTSLVLIFSGILLTIISAVLNYSFLSNNDKRINELKNQTESIERQVAQFWLQKTTLEQKRDTATLLYAIDGKNKKLFSDYVEAVYKHWHIIDKKPVDPKLKFNYFLKANSHNQSVLISKINHVYLKKLALEKKITDIAQKNRFYSSLALLLQMLGMILVLSKHIFD